MKNPEVCESCGHQHLGAHLGSICVGCPCERRPVAVNVFCRHCGHFQMVNAGRCFREGWPLHCGETMTLDRPEQARA